MKKFPKQVVCRNFCSLFLWLYPANFCFLLKQLIKSQNFIQGTNPKSNCSLTSKTENVLFYEPSLVSRYDIKFLTPLASGTGVKLLTCPYFSGSVRYTGMRLLQKNSQKLSQYLKRQSLPPSAYPCAFDRALKLSLIHI